MAIKVKIIVLTALILFLALCYWAWQVTGFSGFDNVLAEPWGIVTIADLGLGAVCATMVIFTTEKNWRVALAWSLPIFLLGNIVTAAWIYLRFAQMPIMKSSVDKF